MSHLIIGFAVMQSLRKVRRYIEGNPVKVGLVERAKDWEWSSARCGRKEKAKTDTDKLQENEESRDTD